MIPLLAVALAFAVTVAAMPLYLRFARRRVLDLPGERRLHAQPTPTGGGLVLLAGLVAGFAVLAAADGLEAGWMIAGGLALVLGLLGFLDDLRRLPVAPRFAAQVLAALALLAVLPGPAGAALPEGLVLAAGLLWLVGFTNAYNFMDGIDGLAAGQACFVALAAALLPGTLQATAPLACAGAAALGFLCWNWPPARVFMGDAGSQSLGFLLAAAPLLLHGDAASAPWGAWLILWAPFLCDATLTLADRARRGCRLSEGHREHAYQRLALAAGGHRRVTLGILALDVTVLLPLALLSAAMPGLAPALACLALAGCGLAVIVVFRRHPVPCARVEE